MWSLQKSEDKRGLAETEQKKGTNLFNKAKYLYF